MRFSNWWENRRFVSAGPMRETCLLDLVWETLNENASRQARVPDYIYIKGTGEPFFHYKNQQKMRRLKSTARLYIYIYIQIYLLVLVDRFCNVSVPCLWHLSLCHVWLTIISPHQGGLLSRGCQSLCQHNNKAA